MLDPVERNNLGRFVKGSKPWNYLNLPEEKICSLYGDFSSSEIAKKFNCNRGVICDILNRNNIKIKPNGYFFIGQKLSEEHKQKFCYANKGRKLTKEHKENISKSKMGVHQSHGFKKGHKTNVGRKNKQETIELMRSIRKDKTYEEIFGKEKAEKIRKNQSIIRQDINPEEWKKFISREPYDQKWTKNFRKSIRKRDNYICMVCKIHQEKLNRALAVHHINYDKQLSITPNCISLCRKCHRNTNDNRKHWQSFLQTLLVEEYGYKYNEKGEVLLNVTN